MALVDAERIAVAALRAYLLRVLPAKVTETNTARALVFRSSLAEPFTVPNGAVLKFRVVNNNVALGPYTAPLTAGSRTAAQVAADINAGAGIHAFDPDTKNRLYTQLTLPAVVEILADTTGANTALGWDAGGELVTRELLVAPSTKGVVDGEHSIVDVGPGFGVIIGDRTGTNTNRNVRYDERDVVMQLGLYVPLPNASELFAGEAVSAAVTCVRSAIFDDRTLDGAAQFSDVDKTIIYGKVFRFANQAGMSPLLANAQLQVKVRVFERAP